MVLFGLGGRGLGAEAVFSMCVRVCAYDHQCSAYATDAGGKKGPPASCWGGRHPPLPPNFSSCGRGGESAASLRWGHVGLLSFFLCSSRCCSPSRHSPPPFLTILVSFPASLSFLYLSLLSFCILLLPSCALHPIQALANPVNVRMMMLSNGDIEPVRELTGRLAAPLLPPIPTALLSSLACPVFLALSLPLPPSFGSIPNDPLRARVHCAAAFFPFGLPLQSPLPNLPIPPSHPTGPPWVHSCRALTLPRRPRRGRHQRHPHGGPIVQLPHRRGHATGSTRRCYRGHHPGGGCG